MFYTVYHQVIYRLNVLTAYEHKPNLVTNLLP